MSNTKQFSYRNTTETDLDVIGVGVVKAGGTITSDEPLTNPNLELLQGEFASKSAARRTEALSKPAAPAEDKE